ncbi:JmjN domain [Sesbania bispinosa]|nr:JmjN domain [Sesbania bispinosa]
MNVRKEEGETQVAMVGEVFPWLKSLPVALEYRSSAPEFQDPIGYIFKIEKEASKYGICKIIPPIPPSLRKPQFPT